jgi:hypothetical protein
VAIATIAKRCKLHGGTLANTFKLVISWFMGDSSNPQMGLAVLE